ncbi:MAG: hypothetical protein WCA08_12685, partial [Desulfoferrobacter sp.]
RHFAAAFLLEQQIAHLRSIAMRDDDSILIQQTGDLPNRQFQVLELLFNASRLAFPNKCVPAQGNEQDRFLGILFLRVHSVP